MRITVYKVGEVEILWNYGVTWNVFINGDEQFAFTHDGVVSGERARTVAEKWLDNNWDLIAPYLN